MAGEKVTSGYIRIIYAAISAPAAFVIVVAAVIVTPWPEPVLVWAIPIGLIVAFACAYACVRIQYTRWRRDQRTDLPAIRARIAGREKMLRRVRLSISILTLLLAIAHFMGAPPVIGAALGFLYLVSFVSMICLFWLLDGPNKLQIDSTSARQPHLND